MPESSTETIAADTPAAGGKRPRARSSKPRVSKRDQLIRMLSAPTGAGADVISRKLGWQRHTIRAAVSGLRKEGIEIHTAKPAGGKPSRYRIIARGAGHDAG